MINEICGFGFDITEVKINKEVRDYQESLFFGLSLRQFIFALLAVLVAVAVYFLLRNVSADVGWICILAAFPFALGSFFRYNGMNITISANNQLMKLVSLVAINARESAYLVLKSSTNSLSYLSNAAICLLSVKFF